MNTRWMRAARRVGIELALLIEGVVAVACAWGRGSPALLGAIGSLTCLAVAAGVWRHWRTGRLDMAWHCPRLDALNLSAGTRDAPWTALRCADRALATFEGEGRRYREFFPEARLDILKSASRVLDAHRLRERARKALVDAPQGPGRARLEQQADRTTRELVNLTAMLQQLRVRLIASTAPAPSVEDPAPALRALELRSFALGEAVDDLDRAPSDLVHEGGVR